MRRGTQRSRRTRRCGCSDWTARDSSTWSRDRCHEAPSIAHPTATWNTEFEEERMVCWHCRRTAVGSCRFCGRGVCEDHAREQPYVLELFRGSDMTRALVVEDALF